MAPMVFFRAALDALTEQVRRRVKSVDAGEQWKATHPNRVMQMPEGALSSKPRAHGKISQRRAVTYGFSLRFKQW